ncbi:hypothetical protein C8Q77DRAFT_1064140 [Trametes polyzona]|nr:hypothetical protein C8Q77DRAFT_1064140 [Trametes polyzona]
MDRLPEELVAYIFDYVQAARALSTAMLVNRQWYMLGARNLHASLTLSLGFDMDIDSQDAVMTLMKRLVSPTFSTAHLVRHIVIYGLARTEVHNLILDILRHATGLRSLDIHALHLLQDGSFFPHDAFGSPEFLTSLVALNITSTPSLASLAHKLRLQSLRVHDAMDRALLRRITDPNGNLIQGIRSLELVVSAENPRDAVEDVAYLASALARAPLHALALQFVLGRPGLMTWPDFTDAVLQMGPSLRAFRDLSILGIVIRPDPIMSSASSAEPGSGEQQRELMTRALAERLVADHGLSRLTRVELRWHGWRIRDGQLTAVLRPEFLRLPQNWLYKQSGDGE